MAGGLLRDSATAALLRRARSALRGSAAAVRSSLVWRALSSARGVEEAALAESRLLAVRVPAPALFSRLHREPAYYVLLAGLLLAARWAAPAATAAPLALLVFAAVDRLEEDYARLAFLLGLAALLAAEVGHAFSYGYGDASLYLHRGLRLAAAPLGELWGRTQQLTDGANLHVFYELFLGLLFKALVPSALVAKVVQLLPLAASAALVHRIARLYLGPRWARLVTLVFVLHPGLYLFGTALMRDVFVLYFLLQIVYLYLRFREGGGKRYLLYALPVLPLLMLTRSYLALLLLAAVAADYLLSPRLAEGRWGGLGFLAFLAVGGLLLGLSPFGPFGLGAVQALLRGDLAQVQEFPGSVVSAAELDLVTYPLFLLKLLVSPVPGKAVEPYQWLLPQSLLYLAALPFLAVGAVRALFGEKRGMAVIPLTLILGLVAFYALYFQGGGPRQRLQLEPFLLMLSAYGFSQVGRDRRFLWAYGGYLLAAAAGVWLAQ